MLSENLAMLRSLKGLSQEQAAEKLNKHAVLKVGQETTLPGSAAAALLNCGA